MVQYVAEKVIHRGKLKRIWWDETKFFLVCKKVTFLLIMILNILSNSLLVTFLCLNLSLLPRVPPHDLFLFFWMISRQS